MPRDRDVVAVASATSTGLLERAGPISQAVSGATVTRPSPSSLYRKGSDNSARLEHLILFDRRREAEGGVPLLVEKRADAGSRSRILRGGGDRLVDHRLLEL
jgi:hypothetical protein